MKSSTVLKVVASVALAVATATVFGSGGGGSGPSYARSPTMSLQTYPAGVRFNSYQESVYQWNTGDSVYFYESRLYLNVWQNGSGGAGLVCSGSRIVYDNYASVAGAHIFSSTLTVSNSPRTSVIYANQTFRKGSVGFDLYHKTAEALEYSGLFGGLTCQGGGAVPSDAFVYSIPGWNAFAPPGVASYWDFYSYDCWRIPCDVEP